MRNRIGIRDLRDRASGIVREVREEMAEYVVTRQGAPVAVLRPFTDEDAADDLRSTEELAIAEMKQLAQEVAEAWTSPKSGVELVEEQRR